MKKIAKSLMIVMTLSVILSMFTLTASAASTSSGLPVMNSFFSVGDDTAASNYGYFDKNGQSGTSQVYQIKVTGKVATSATGVVQNYLYVYHVEGDADAYIKLPASGTFTVYLDANVPLKSGWYFQLVSFRNTGLGSAAATTLTNGNVTWYY